MTEAHREDFAIIPIDDRSVFAGGVLANTHSSCLRSHSVSKEYVLGVELEPLECHSIASAHAHDQSPR